jgi:hypothetical protein
MAIRHMQPPVGALNAAIAGLREISQTGRASSLELRRVASDRLRLTRPQPVYFLGLDDLRAGRGVDAARPIGWRYLVEADNVDQPLALAETVAQADGTHAFAHLNYGPFVAGTAAALHAAGQLAGVDADIRLLHIPALYFVALWLHQDGGDAVLIPVAPAPEGIAANRSYSASQLLALLTARARQLPDMSRDDNRGS